MNPGERLRCTASHVAAIRRMVEEDSPGPAVLTQIQAVHGSLRAVARILVSDEVRRTLGAVEVERASDLTEELERVLLPGRSRR